MVRVSRHWWLVLGVTNVSSRTSAAFFKPGLDIADVPLVGFLAERQAAVLGLLEIFLGPLDGVQFGRRHSGPFPGLRRRRRHANPNVSVGSGVRAAGPQTHQRIDDERQRLEIDFDFFNRFGGGEFVDRGHGENRLALKQRLIGQRLKSPGVGQDHSAVIVDAVGRSGQIVRGENRFDAGHRQRRARVDAADARMRHRAQRQLAEEHAVGAIILGVFRLARHLREEVAGRVVLADQFVFIWWRYVWHGYAFLRFSAPRIIAVRILS